MRCILHIGTEKTGTTALQSVLSQQRELLLSHGVHYAAAPGELNCRSLAAAFTPQGVRDDYLTRTGLTEPEKFTQWRHDLLAQISQEIAAARGRCHTYILSSEHLSSRLTTGTSVEHLAEYLRSEFEEIRVVCYLRRQDLLATSRISEGLRAGFPQRWFPDLVNSAGLPPLYDYEALIKRWSACFGESAIQLRIFQRSQLVGGDVVADFSESQLEVPLGQDGRETSNVSLSLVAQLALMMFNHAMGVEARFHVSKHRRELAQYLERVAPGADGKPSRSKALAFYEHFRKGNGYLADRYFQRPQLFDEDFKGYPEHELEADTELAASLLRDFYLSGFLGRDCADETNLAA